MGGAYEKPVAKSPGISVLSRRRLDEYRGDPQAFLEVRCAFGTAAEAVFEIPMPYLLEQVIPHADCNERGQYLFSVNPQDFTFTWDHGFRMEGRRFLARGE